MFRVVINLFESIDTIEKNICPDKQKNTDVIELYICENKSGIEKLTAKICKMISNSTIRMWFVIYFIKKGSKLYFRNCYQVLESFKLIHFDQINNQQAWADLSKTQVWFIYLEVKRGRFPLRKTITRILSVIYFDYFM